MKRERLEALRAEAKAGTFISGVDVEALCDELAALTDDSSAANLSVSCDELSCTAADLRVVAKLLDQKRQAAADAGRGVMLSWEDAHGFALTLHAAANALSDRDADLDWLAGMGFLRDFDGTWRFGLCYVNGLLTENVSVKGPTTLRAAIDAAQGAGGAP